MKQLFWNARGLGIEKKTYIKYLADIHSPILIGIIEPNSPNFMIPGYQTIVKEDITRGTGVMLLVRNDINIKYVNQVNEWIIKIVIQIHETSILGIWIIHIPPTVKKKD